MTFRWITEEELYCQETGEPVPDAMKALHLASRKISLTIQCKSVDTAKTRLMEEDTAFKERSKHAADALDPTFTWDGSRQRTFYRQVAKSGSVVSRLGFSTNTALPESGRMRIGELLSMVQSWLRTSTST